MIMETTTTPPRHNNREQDLQEQLDASQALVVMLQARVRELEDKAYQDMQEKAVLMAKLHNYEREQGNGIDDDRVNREAANSPAAAAAAAQIETDEKSEDDTREEEDESVDDASSERNHSYPSSMQRRKNRLHPSERRHKSHHAKSKQNVKECFTYSCPVYQCEYELQFEKSVNPPLNEDKETVSDQIHWKGVKYKIHKQAIRLHMRQKHPEIVEEKWPPGFAIVCPERQNRLNRV